MRARWSSLLLLAVVASGACSSSDEAARETDAGLQPGDAASDGDSGADGYSDCAMPLSDACANKPGLCAVDWPSDVMTFCSTYQGSFFKSVSLACGPYYRLISNGVDMGYSFYYEKVSGKLLAVVFHNYNHETATCVGGPADFVEPICDTSVELDCQDAGDASAADSNAD